MTNFTHRSLRVLAFALVAGLPAAAFAGTDAQPAKPVAAAPSHEASSAPTAGAAGKSDTGHRAPVKKSTKKGAKKAHATAAK
jgi:hypothetical protein